MKRLELGRLSADGTFGLRISAPGHDVGDPAGRLLFDTDTPLAMALARTSIAVGYTRQVLTTRPPYGLEGSRTTVFRHQSSWSFPVALTFAPVCQIGFTTNIGGVVRSYDANRVHPDSQTTIEYESGAGGVVVTISEGQPGEVDYATAPVHRITVLNVPRP